MLVEGLLIAVAGSLFGLGLAVASQGLINRYFQWHYDTALVFVRITPDVALRCVGLAVPLGALASVAASWVLLRRGLAVPGPPMNALAFAWRSLVRQPARAVLGIVGVAAVCALLFDMLLLSRGLVLSMQDLLEQAGFAIRVTATQALPGSGPRIRAAVQVAAAIAALPEVDEAVPLVFGDAEITSPDHAPTALRLVLRGRRLDAAARGHLSKGATWREAPGSPGRCCLNRQLADVLGRRPGDTVTLARLVQRRVLRPRRPSC